MSETIGLDIGSHSIKLVGLKTTSKGTFLTHIGIKEIPPGEDQAQANNVSEVLKDLLKNVGIKPGKVNLTVSGSGVNIQRISIPSMPKAELKEAVRWEIKGRLPFLLKQLKSPFIFLMNLLKIKLKN